MTHPSASAFVPASCTAWVEKGLGGSDDLDGGQTVYKLPRVVINLLLYVQISTHSNMNRSILGNATNVFRRASSSGEDALGMDERYDMIRSIGRGSFGKTL